MFISENLIFFFKKESTRISFALTKTVSNSELFVGTDFIILIDGNFFKLISENFKSLYYTSLASIFLISFFYITPLTLNFISKIFSEKKIVLNESNKNFNRVLDYLKMKIIL